MRGPFFFWRMSRVQPTWQDNTKGAEREGANNNSGTKLYNNNNNLSVMITLPFSPVVARRPYREHQNADDGGNVFFLKKDELEIGQWMDLVMRDTARNWRKANRSFSSPRRNAFACWLLTMANCVATAITWPSRKPFDKRWKRI